MIIQEYIHKNVYISNDEDKKVFEETVLPSLNAKVKVDTKSWIDIEKCQNVYIVKPLDTVFSVSKKLGLTTEELIEKAGGKNIFIGQRITF